MFIISKRAVDVPTGQTDGNRSFKRQRGLEWVSREEPALEEFGGLMMCGFSGREYMNKGPSGECRCPTSMANLAWNVRGLGNRETTRALWNSIQKLQPDIVFLSETKQQKKFLKKTKVKMKLTHSYYVEPVGLARGLSYGGPKQLKLRF
ncbi:hypothetical protein V6N12_048113 [Hibiscus sabdariffa]|uniref:Endonuclease/exonuclease/phosphatase domain-containing protein n=1 Tax=Hibiscus sabdariffa TaxID=183260 RepID=A0ABR1ZN24_9ROSI